MVYPAPEEALNEKLLFITEEPFFSAGAKLLDNIACENSEEGDLLEACETLVDHLKDPFEANGFIKNSIG